MCRVGSDDDLAALAGYTEIVFVIENKEVLMIESCSVERLRSQIETVGCLLASVSNRAFSFLQAVIVDWPGGSASSDT